MSAIRLGPGGEFDVIRDILSGDEAAEPALRVGPGDDAAVLARCARVLSTDLSVEGIHFRREWLRPEEIGYRATMAALSDLAAMGADPLAVLVSLAAPPEDAASGYLADVGRGTRDAAREVGAALAGGDVTRSPGPLVVDVVVVGETDAPVLRSGAAPGDEVWVTGTLGGAAAAVRLLEAGSPLPSGLRQRFARPRPRFAAMREIRGAVPVTAGMDVSDGILQDAGHLAASSGVRITLSAHLIPVDPGVEHLLQEEDALQVALSGGEDYELLLTLRPGLAQRASAISARLGIPLTRVGVVEEGSGVGIVDPAGHPVLPGRTGFDHFPGGGPGGGGW